MKFSRLVCSVAVALAGLAMTGESYAKSGRGGGHGGHGGGNRGGHGSHSGGHHGKHSGGHHGKHSGGHHGKHSGGHHGKHSSGHHGKHSSDGRHGKHSGHHGKDGGGHHRKHGGAHHANHGWVSRSFYGYGYGYGYPYYFGYPYYYYYRGYPTVYRGYVANDYYALAVWVQKALARGGYYHGPIDGIIGKGTRRAIRGYRAAHGLPVSSRIDDELLKTLGGTRAS